MVNCAKLFRGGCPLNINGNRRGSKVQHLWRHLRERKPGKATHINILPWTEQVKAWARSWGCKNRILSKRYLGNHELEEDLYVGISHFSTTKKDTGHYHECRGSICINPWFSWESNFGEKFSWNLLILRPSCYFHARNILRKLCQYYWTFLAGTFFDNLHEPYSIAVNLGIAYIRLVWLQILFTLVWMLEEAVSVLQSPQ